MIIIKILLYIVAALLVVATICGGIYVSFYECLWKGIVQIIDAANQTPVSSTEVAWGIVRIFCMGIAGGITYLVGFLIASVTAALATMIK